MSRIRVRIKGGHKAKVNIKNAQPVQVKTDTTYLYDPTIIDKEVQQAKDWAIKTDGLVEEEGVGIDYSAKAYAIGGTGTQTNNAKYYAEQAGISETNASNSATSASGSASSASSSALLAKDWATKIDGTVDGVDYSSKYYAQQITPIATDITTVAGIASDVTTVANNSTNITTVAGNTTNINKVASDINRVNLVADDINSVHTVAVDISTVIDVANNKTNIDTVAGIESDVTAVAGNATNINAVADNETNINAVNANKTNIDAVAGNATNINAVANNSTNINAVAGNATNINVVASDATNIDAVAGDLTNIDAVANDLTNIDNASTYANNAHIWAEGSDAQVAGLGGEKSSKGWAARAKELVDSIGSVLHYKGSVATRADLPSSGQVLGDMYNITSDGSNVVWNGSDWDDISGIVDLSAYRTASDQDTIDAGKVPTTRTVNGKALSSDISLNASDVGAQPAGNYMTTDTVQAVGAGATKTFNGRVNFIGEGDSKAIYLSTDTRIDVYGTTRTVLGFANGTFLINNAAYPLNLRGSGARPAWNSSSYLALTSDIGNATLTIQKNGTAVDTFTANATSDKAINITVPTKTSDLTNDDGFITGITSSDVTTALGYTPYNSTNPSGYQANVIETVKVNGTALTPSSKAVDITVPTNNNQLTNGAGYITSSALTGYATETWVGQQGFLTSTALNGYATESWVGQQGYITGITSSDVTTALGYTPYDSSNPNGYTSNTGTVTSVNNVSPVNGNVSLSIPTVNNPTITITQGGVTKGSFTLNQASGDTIALDAGGGSVNTFNLFDHKWSDYQLNDQSWLRADTFSWQDGTAHSDAYNHLVADYNGGTSQTETVGSYTITYVLATDGHKITTDETNALNIYNESGVAWYYILDTTNQRFKLPRTKYGFVGLRDTVGNYVPESLPNIKATFATPYTRDASPSDYFSGCVSQGEAIKIAVNAGQGRNFKSVLNASVSSSAYQDNAPVQQRATQMYLYFYVGQYSQSATEQTAGLNAELFNGKADTDLNNVSAGIDFVVESYNNGTEWYRLYKSGWIEQGGYVENTGTAYSLTKTTVTFLKEFSDTNYSFTRTDKAHNLVAQSFPILNGSYTTKSKDKIIVANDSNNMAYGFDWEAKGMSAQS